MLLPSERLEISLNCTRILGRCASGSERNCARSFRENREVQWSTHRLRTEGAQIRDDGEVEGIAGGCGVQPDWRHYAGNGTSYLSSGPGLGSVVQAALAVHGWASGRSKAAYV